LEDKLTWIGQAYAVCISCLNFKLIYRKFRFTQTLLFKLKSMSVIRQSSYCLLFRRFTFKIKACIWWGIFKCTYNYKPITLSLTVLHLWLYTNHNIIYKYLHSNCTSYDAFLPLKVFITRWTQNFRNTSSYHAMTWNHELYYLIEQQRPNPFIQSQFSIQMLMFLWDSMVLNTSWNSLIRQYE